MKNFIWDFDGMLFDSYPHIAKSFQLAMSEKGIDVDFDRAKALFEISFATAYDYYKVTDEIKQRHKEYEHDYELEPAVVPFPNTVETIKTLSGRGARNFLYTHRGHETSQHYLEKYGLREYFDGFVDSGMEFPPKPAPDAVEYICSRYGLDKSETIMTGDREIDVMAGKNAGVFGCLFTRDLSQDTEADFKINDIIQITRL